MSGDRTTSDREARAVGTLLGLACGDALGRPVEFRSAERIEREYGQVTEMLGNGTHGKPAGTITDDTELALCLARSLAERGTFDGADVARRFVSWYESGPFDIGGMTRRSLERVRNGAPWDEAGEAEWEASPEGSNAGNGSVMRCAPIALAFADDESRLVDVSRQSSAITHADPRCTDGCAVLNRTLAGYLRGETDPLGGALAAESLDDMPTELTAALAAVPDGIREAGVKNSGYVVSTLQAALFYALDADDFESAVTRAVSAGGDADTVGAIAGAVAGARFGADAIPDRWADAIDERDELRDLALTLVG